MRFFLVLTPKFDRVLGFDLDRAERLFIDQADDRSQEEVSADNKGSGQRACNEFTESSEGSDHRRAPERRSGI